MEEWIQLILFLIFGTGALLSRVLSRRGSQEEPDVLPEEEEITLPPWGNAPMEEEEYPLPEVVDKETPVAPPEPPSAIQGAATSEPAEKANEDQPSRTTPTIAGIPLSPETFRQGIILAEILRPPKSIRESRQ